MKTGTHSATQSGLDKYINDRIKNSDGKFKPIDQTKQVVRGTHSHAAAKTGTHSHAAAKTGTHSFHENIKPEHFNILKSIGTHSVLSESKTKGVTHSHPILHYTKQKLEFKTQSSVNYGLSVNNHKISYNNPKLIKGTHSGSYTWIANTEKKDKPLGKNAMSYEKINGTHSNNLIGGIKGKAKFGLNTGTNIEKKFYVKTNSNTQKLPISSFLDFVGEMSENADKMIKLQEVTVNGEVVTDINHTLKSGDVVRVGIGHYVNNSEKIAIVK